MAVGRLFPKNRFAGFEGRRLDIDGQSRRKTAHQSVGEALDFGRGRVGREDDLLSRLVQRIEDVEKLVLCLCRTAPVLDVVDQENIDIFAVEGGPFVRVAVADAFRIIALEIVCGNVADNLSRRVSKDIVADRLQKMRLSQPGSSVDEERVVLAVIRILGNGERCAEGELRLVPDDKVLEAEFLGELDRLAEIVRRRGYARVRFDMLEVKIQMLAGGFLPTDFEKNLVGQIGLDVLIRRQEDGAPAVGDTCQVQLCEQIVKNGIRNLAVQKFQTFLELRVHRA